MLWREFAPYSIQWVQDWKSFDSGVLLVPQKEKLSVCKEDTESRTLAIPIKFEERTIPKTLPETVT